jgi:hypothetical protein
MLFPLVVIVGLVALAIVLAGISKRNPKVLLLSTALLWLMAIAAAVPVAWAWRERAYSENWAMLGVMFISVPLIFTVLVLGTVMLIVAKLKKMPLTKATTISLFSLGAFLVCQVLLIFLTAR